MNRYSLILIDIDGTLLDSFNEISPNTKNLLRRLQKKGVPVTLTSARSPGAVEAVARQAEVSAPIVCYGGGLILDEKRSILQDAGMDANTALAFKAFVNREFPDISVNSYLYDIWLADNPDNEETRRLAEINGGEPLQGDLASAMRMSSRVHKFVCAGTPQRVRQLRERAETAFPALKFTLSGAVYLQALRGDASKCAAMKILQRRYGLDVSRVVAIGVSLEDAETLRQAGMGIAMGNAPDAVKNAANRVTASHDNEGVYIALKGLRFQAPESVETGLL